MSKETPAQRRETDEHIGAVECDRPNDEGCHGNPSGPAVDAEGLPNDPVATAQDKIGANLDETEGG